MEKLNILSPIICIVAIVIAIVAILFVFVKCRNLQRKIDELNERIDKRKTDANLLEQNLRREIESLKLPLKLLRNQSNSTAVQSSPCKDSESHDSFIGKFESKSIEERPNHVEHTLYASSYDCEEKQFFSIENVPSTKSIYVISYYEDNPEEGKFTIFKEAEKKVVECKDHLDVASEIEGRGHRIDWTSLRPGKLRKKDNNWEVIEPLTVKFV